jgi:hypothetical protein
MEFLKKNYEKVILSVVLLGLAIAAGLLLTRVADENRRVDEIRQLNLTATPQELESMETSTNLALLNRMQRSNRVVLTGTNNLFNPVLWQRRGPDDRPLKIETGAEVGPRALEILETKPLYFRVSFVGRSDQGGNTQYSFRIQREGASRPSDRRAATLSFIRVGSDNAGLRLRELRPPEEPTEFVFEAAEDRSQVVVGVNRDFERVMGYLATLRYEPDNRTFRDKRVDDTISLDGTPYKIVAISETSVTVEAPNKARTTVTTKPASVAESP